jgi:hypothetical protein
VGSVTGNVGGNVAGSVASVTAGVTLANDAITAAKFDESTAFPLTAADTGSTAVARTGADSDTLETLSDQLDLTATASALTTVGTNVSTLLTRITSTLFTGITSLAEWLGLLAGKQTGNSTARTELRATGAGSGTYDETTDALQAIRDRGDAAWTTATGFSTLDAAGVRSAVGLASANLDTQLADLPTNAELATALGTADDAVLAAIAALNNLSAAQVNAEVDTALADIHLDHLLAADYDPANKPGTATALLNELVESDAGVSQFTANALELAPTGGSAPTAVQIRQEMDANSTQLAAIVEDTGTTLPATLATIAAYVDTEVAAIKAKTDLIPASPAAVGDIPTVSQIWTTALTEAYKTAGSTGTAAQLLYEILANLTDFSISGTTKTARKLDGTTAKTYTLNDATSPTAITEAT